MAGTPTRRAARGRGAGSHRGEPFGGIGLLLLALAAPSVAWATPDAAPTKPGAVPAGPAPAASVRDLPGWYPADDPESLAVVRGRRDAAPVAMPFTGGAPDLDSLGRAVVAALNAGSRDSLWRLCVTEQEFGTILWPEFPESRPATRATAEDGWFFLSRRLNAGVTALVREHGSQGLAFVRLEHPGAPREYRNFRLHDGIRLVVRRPGGAEEPIEVVRTVAERRGRFKIYSTDD